MRTVRTLAISSSRHAAPVAGVLIAVLALAPQAAAQVDVSPPLPNVLLLVDTSGSMEYGIDGSRVPCQRVDSSLAGEPQGTSGKSRWTQLVEVLTGDIVGYSCRTQDRRSAAFRDEYKLGTANAPDYNYSVPHHRILYQSTPAQPCTIGPGILDTNAFAWGSTPFRYHVWNDPTVACPAPQQSSTGLLDSFADRARFALMTFDTQTDAGTGIATGTSANYATGTSGTWSYFLNWRDDPTCPVDGSGNPHCARGKPAGCIALTPMEVGARNAAAPPWEGRMISFGKPSSSIAEIHQNSERIQQALLAARPFGATPINGMLADARDFLTQDTSNDPTATGTTTCSQDPDRCLGPKLDPFVVGGCRKNYIILLTDGEPNLDLRPWCEPSTGVCPFQDRPEVIVDRLAHPASGNPILTFVIGFALSTVDLGGNQAPIDCSTLSSNLDLYCGASMNPKLAACCTLAKLAYSGGTGNAHFASNANELRSALSGILSQISSVSTSRTVPVFGSGAATAGTGGSFTFYSSFVVASGAMWRGSLTRERTICVTEQQKDGTTRTYPATQDVNQSLADDFAYNVNHASSDSAHPRHYYTVLAAPDATGNRWSERSIRPSLTSNLDGAGVQSGSRIDQASSDFATMIPATAMHITAAACADASITSADACAARIMHWEIGDTSGTLPNRAGNVFGDIYHATPVLVGPPSENLRDESYTAFAAANATRPVVLYAATNDGQLHAFKVAAVDPADTFRVNQTPAQNELWSFFPPAVLPRIISQYPNSHQLLLDSSPVVKDVAFQRSARGAQSGGAVGDWHTVLVEGFGAGGGGYFALDITKPVPNPNDATSGPRFLWQLTTDASGAPLFGARSGIPAIATLYFTPPGQSEAMEYAVAILPGGEGGVATGASCPRQGTAPLVDPGFPPRGNVQCWPAGAARSVTVVMLETGEIIRTFRAAVDGPASTLGRAGDPARYAQLYAPMVGQPVVFPGQAGSVADRLFIGDADGMLWRLDLSSTDPREWTAKLWFDAYNTTVIPSTNHLVVGQPIVTAPVMSVDSLGNVTIAFSTGDQESFQYASGMKNFLYSLKENPLSTPEPFQSELQWYSAYNDGARVSGPMQIYSGTIYYTTMTPTAAADRSRACQAGSSSLCAVDYLAPTGTRTSGEGGAAALPPPDDRPQDPHTQCRSLGDVVAFGAAIVQKPTCSVQEVYSDPYLGLPNHVSLGGGITGGESSVVVNGVSPTTGARPTQISLPPPRRTTRIDSWASLIE